MSLRAHDEVVWFEVDRRSRARGGATSQHSTTYGNTCDALKKGDDHE